MLVHGTIMVEIDFKHEKARIIIIGRSCTIQIDTLSAELSAVRTIQQLQQPGLPGIKMARHNNHKVTMQYHFAHPCAGIRRGAGLATTVTCSIPYCTAPPTKSMSRFGL